VSLVISLTGSFIFESHLTGDIYAKFFQKKKCPKF